MSIEQTASASFHHLLLQRGSRRALLRWTATGVALGAVTLTGHRSAPTSAQEPATSAIATATPAGPVIPPEVASHPTDWPVLHQNYAAHRAAADSAITSQNVADLGIAWRFPITAQGAWGAVTAIPIVIGDTVYVQDMESNVVALNRGSGDVIWQNQRDAIHAGPNGVAVGYGLVFGSEILGARLFALDAATGEERWNVRLSANANEFIFMQPIVYDSVVYCGTSAGTYVGGSKGIFFAVDALTGNVLWQWDTTTNNLWGNARLNSGGGLWYGPSVDERGNVFFGVGNPGPWPGSADHPLGASRPGDNLYTSSMVSLDTATGSLRWYVQTRPHDNLDHDFQNTPVLATVEIDGTPTNLAIGSGKAGVVIAANAETGVVIWNTPVGTHNAYGDGLESPGATPGAVTPGGFGGVLTPIAFANDTLFVPVINWPSYFTASALTGMEGELTNARGEMVALNAADGSIKWRTEVPTFFSADATLANDLVFGGGLDGIVRGFEIETGTEVWSVQTGAGLNAPFAVVGDMLLVPAGGFLISTLNPPPTPQNELIAFKLGATAPASASPIAAATPAATPPADATPETAPAG